MPRGRVLIVVENLPVPYDRRVWREATTLRAAGYSVTVISPSGPHAPPGAHAIEGVQVYRYPMLIEGDSKFRLLIEYGWAALCIGALAVWTDVRRGFDVIQVCNPPDIFWPLLFWCRALRKVTVFDHHDLAPEMYQGKFGERDDFFHRLLLRMERLTFRAADFVISTNQSYRAIARERGKIPDERGAIVRNGPDPERLFHVPPDPAWRKERATLVAFLGEIGEQDGVDRLIDAIHTIVHRHRRHDIHFVVMGGGPNYAEIVAHAHRLAVDGWITFTGRVDADVISSVLSTADIAVDPSPQSAYADKSTAAKIMEYMLFGLPVVAFRLTETQESAGDAAIYADPTDVTAFAHLILQLADDSAQRLAIGRCGRVRVMGGLLWQHSAMAYLEVMERAGKLRNDRVGKRSRGRLRRPFLAATGFFRRPN
jgi:glycosyltransferase involved in cell wall biosynthesis